MLQLFLLITHIYPSDYVVRKTETTKIIMAFLAKVSSLNRRRDSLGTIQCNVLEANTILDAVGNARTMRNDNSSRFGKYVKLHFDTAGELVGAGLDTFLLETTRYGIQQWQWPQPQHYSNIY